MSKTKYYSIDKDEVVGRLESDAERGLDPKEAARRRDKYGPNELRKKEEKGIFEILLDQVNNPVIYLLAAATVVSFIMGDVPEGIAITVVILLNVIIGFWMEYRAKTSMNALKEMDKIMATVIRDGSKTDIDSVNLVPGDILYMEAGDVVPADARVVDSSELKVDEAPLTGESVPVEKHCDAIDEDTSLPDRTNMIYKGTSITHGNARAVVTETGMDTQIGDISRMVEEAGEEELPLNRKLNRLTHRLIWIIGGLAAAFFALGWLGGKELYLMFQTAVAWAIAAIPEGLPVVASIALARGMLRLAERNVIVKRLSAVETLGETTVICTDKTGTLTENQLTVSVIRTTAESHEIKWKSGQPQIQGDPDEEILRHFTRISVFCNNAKIEGGHDGDPLEIALLEYAKALDEDFYKNSKEKNRVNEDPFESESKMMGTINEIDDKYYISSKGAAEAIIRLCDRIRTPGGVRELGGEDREEWLGANDELSSKGLRVLAYAYREVDKSGNEELADRDEFVENMIFLGLVGFIDPPREEVRPAIEDCHRAGIKVVMITGDHPATSFNIAERLNIADEDDSVVRGKNLDKYLVEGEESNSRIVETPVFARIDPGRKLKVVEDFQEAGEIVGVTGDGVNDTPALKKADIGIAMGERGTQAAREVADMVLTDDSFSSIVEAVRQGRIIFGNIRKFIAYQLSYHLAEILLIAAISFSFFELPLLPLQLLFLNLLSDVFPALALALGQGNPEVMNKPPKDPSEAIVTRTHWLEIGLFGIIIAFYVTGIYVASRTYFGYSQEITNNITFFSLALAQFWHVFNQRDDNENILNNQITRNKYIWWALSFCIVALFGAYFAPGLSEVLSFRELTPGMWAMIGIVSLLPLVTIQLIKIFRQGREKI